MRIPGGDQQANEIVQAGTSDLERLPYEIYWRIIHLYLMSSPFELWNLACTSKSLWNRTLGESAHDVDIRKSLETVNPKFALSTPNEPISSHYFAFVLSQIIHMMRLSLKEYNKILPSKKSAIVALKALYTPEGVRRLHEFNSEEAFQLYAMLPRTGYPSTVNVSVASPHQLTMMSPDTFRKYVTSKPDETEFYMSGRQTKVPFLLVSDTSNDGYDKLNREWIRDLLAENIDVDVFYAKYENILTTIWNLTFYNDQDRMFLTLMLLLLSSDNLATIGKYAAVDYPYSNILLDDNFILRLPVTYQKKIAFSRDILSFERNPNARNAIYSYKLCTNFFPRQTSATSKSCYAPDFNIDGKLRMLLLKTRYKCATSNDYAAFVTSLGANIDYVSGEYRLHANEVKVVLSDVIRLWNACYDETKKRFKENNKKSKSGKAIVIAIISSRLMVWLPHENLKELNDLILKQQALTPLEILQILITIYFDRYKSCIDTRVRDEVYRLGNIAKKNPIKYAYQWSRSLKKPFSGLNVRFITAIDVARLLLPKDPKAWSTLIREICMHPTAKTKIRSRRLIDLHILLVHLLEIPHIIAMFINVINEFPLLLSSFIAHTLASFFSNGFGVVEILTSIDITTDDGFNALKALADAFGSINPVDDIISPISILLRLIMSDEEPYYYKSRFFFDSLQPATQVKYLQTLHEYLDKPWAIEGLTFPRGKERNDMKDRTMRFESACAYPGWTEVQEQRKSEIDMLITETLSAMMWKNPISIDTTSASNQDAGRPIDDCCEQTSKRQRVV
jgi:hypothetical protein